MRQLRTVELGDFFTLKAIENPTEKQIWIRDEYDRHARKFLAIRFDDISVSRLFDADRMVFTDFTF